MNNKLNIIFILLLIMTSACTKFEATNINKKNTALNDSVLSENTSNEGFAEGNQNIDSNISEQEVVPPTNPETNPETNSETNPETSPEAETTEPNIGEANGESETPNSQEITNRLQRAFYVQVENEIKTQNTTRQNRPATLPECKNLAQLTSLFGCSMFSQRGLRQNKVITADIKIYMADPEKQKLDKVAFIVASHNFENPKSINHEARYTSRPSGAKKIYDELAAKNISVVFIGFGYKDFYLNSIYEKADATARAIKLVNQLRTSDQPSFLMGLSLGGVIGRMALNQLELNGINLHNVSHYLSFDSPHRGAHVPLSLQYIMKFLENGASAAKRKAQKFQNNFGRLIDDILNLNDFADQLEGGIASADAFANQVKLFSSVYLNSFFARELVIQQSSRESLAYTDVLYTRLQNHLQLTGMPELTEVNIGVTNGSIHGLLLPLSGNQYVTLDTKLKNYVEVDFTSYIAKTSTNSIFSGRFKYPDPEELGGFFGGDGTDNYSFSRLENSSVADLDKSTCGYLNAVGDIEKAISSQLSRMFPEKLNITNRKACFIPTTSGLASTTPITYKGPITAQDSLFDEIIGGRTNSHHLEFTTEISNGILEVIKRSY